MWRCNRAYATPRRTRLDFRGHQSGNVPMSKKGVTQAKAIEFASPDEVRALFTEQYGEMASSRISVEWLRGNLAWAAQVQASGREPEVLRATMEGRLAKLRGRGKDIVAPGTRLIRTWGGETHEVTVLEQGYLWQGRRYRSLSAIAGEITGTRWSGPRFFGLRDAR